MVRQHPRLVHFKTTMVGPPDFCLLCIIRRWCTKRFWVLQWPLGGELPKYSKSFEGEGSEQDKHGGELPDISRNVGEEIDDEAGSGDETGLGGCESWGSAAFLYQYDCWSTLKYVSGTYHMLLFVDWLLIGT